MNLMSHRRFMSHVSKQDLSSHFGLFAALFKLLQTEIKDKDKLKDCFPSCNG